jgi:hypothetical protein
MHNRGDARVRDYISKWNSGLGFPGSFLVDFLESLGEFFGHYLHVRL